MIRSIRLVGTTQEYHGFYEQDGGRDGFIWSKGTVFAALGRISSIVSGNRSHDDRVEVGVKQGREYFCPVTFLIQCRVLELKRVLSCGLQDFPGWTVQPSSAGRTVGLFPLKIRLCRIVGTI